MATTTTFDPAAAEPCIACGAPVDRFGFGHDEGCALDPQDHDYSHGNLDCAICAAAYQRQQEGQVA